MSGSAGGGPVSTARLPSECRACPLRRSSVIDGTRAFRCCGNAREEPHQMTLDEALREVTA